MSEKDLPSYKKYRQSLRIFAHSINIRVQMVSNTDSEGAYVPSRRMIIIDDDLSEASEIACMLHELGHAIDDLLFTDGFRPELENAYRAIYSPKYTKKQKRLVIQCEKRAWRNARRLARQLRINLGKWFDETEKYCLQNYRQNI